MAHLLHLKTCLFLESEPIFGQNRLCFDKEQPDGQKGEKPKPVSISMIGADLGDEKSDKESKEALDKAKQIHEERKDVVEDSKEKLAALRAKLGPLPGQPGAKPKEEDAERKGPKKANETEIEKLKEGPNIPERAKDARTPDQLREDFKNCKSDEEKRTLILDELAKGNVPDHFRTFQKITVEKDGRKFEMLAAPSGFQLGTDKDPIEFPMNGPLAQAIADATGTVLPNKSMVDFMYEQAKNNSQFIPFKPQVFSAEDAAKMRSPEFIETHNKTYREWAKDHGVDLNKPIYGYYKHVIQPEPGVTGPGRLEIYGGFYEDGNRVQPLSGGHHGQDHDDYSQNIQLIMPMAYLDGKPIALSDPKLAELGFPTMPTSGNVYQYNDKMKEAVAKIQSMTPGAVPALPPSAVADNAPLVPALPGAPAKVRSFGGGGGFSGSGDVGGQTLSVMPSVTPKYTGGGGSNATPKYTGGGGVPFEAPRFSANAKVAPSYKPASFVSPEKRELVPGKITGNTLFLGDSIFASVKGASMDVAGERRTFAKGGMTSMWLLDQLQNLRDGKPTDSKVSVDFNLDMFKGGNGVVLIGTNDIGSIGDGRFTKEAIFDRIQQIWKILEDLGMTVYACTIPPFKGHTFSTYRSKYDEVNENRKWINQQIINSGRKVIRIDELVADPNDPDAMSPEYRVGSDHVHPNPGKLSRLLQGEIIKDQSANKPNQEVASDSAAPSPEGLKIPERPKDAPTGSQFMAELDEIDKTPGLSTIQKWGREQQRVVEELSRGNIPPFLFQFKEVTVEANGHTATIKVMPDYLSVGTNDDFVRVPMNGLIAKFVAEKYDCILPTEKLVDDIEANATIVPFFAYGQIAQNIGVPFDGKSQPYMATPAFYRGQNDMIQKYNPQGLIAGEKKDVIYSNNDATNLMQHPNWLSIYGGRFENSSRVQPNNTGGFHPFDYWDYSQGGRLISKNMIVDGKPMRAEDVLSNPDLAPLLNRNGVMDISVMYNLPADVKEAWSNIPGPNFKEQQAPQPQPQAELVSNIPKLVHSFSGNDQPGNKPSVQQTDTLLPNPQKAKSIDTNEMVQFDSVEYKISQGAPGGTITYFKGTNGDEASMTFNGNEYRLKVDLSYQTPNLTGRPEGYTIYQGNPGLIAVMDYAMLYTMLQWNNPQGTEMPFEYEGVKYLAKLAWHGDHPGADLYIQSGPIPQQPDMIPANIPNAQPKLPETAGEQVVDEFDYTQREVGQVLSSGHAKFVQTSNGDYIDFTRNNEQFRVPINLSSGHLQPFKYPPNFFTPKGVSPMASTISWIAKSYFVRKGAEKGDTFTFELNGETYLAQFQTHGKNAGASGPHDGVGLARSA